jgi:hypothetical protein
VRPLLGQLGRQPGAPLPDRLAALTAIGRRVATAGMPRPQRDPLRRARRRLPPTVVDAAERSAQAAVDAAVESAVARLGERPGA